MRSRSRMHIQTSKPTHAHTLIPTHARKRTRLDATGCRPCNADVWAWQVTKAGGEVIHQVTALSLHQVNESCWAVVHLAQHTTLISRRMHSLRSLRNFAKYGYIFSIWQCVEAECILVESMRTVTLRIGLLTPRNSVCLAYKFVALFKCAMSCKCSWWD